MPKIHLTTSNQIDHNHTPIDLTQYPTPHPFEITQCTIGDLHANAIKFIYILIRNGIFLMNPEDYNALVTIYNKPMKISQEDFNLYNDIIDNRITIINRNILIRLIGDTLADRGKNDWFILKIIQKLFQEKVVLRIILSNHDLEFLKGIGLNGNPPLPGSNQTLAQKELADKLLQQWKAQKISLSQYEYAIPRTFSTFYDSFCQGRSFIGLEHCIHSGYITRDSVLAIIEECYLPSLLLVDASFFRGKTIIYSHAHISIDDIIQLEGHLQEKYSSTGHDLRQLVNNPAFLNDPILWAFVWQTSNELIEHGVDHRSKLSKNNHFVCGHYKPSDYYQGPKQFPDNVTCLDNQVGKRYLENPFSETQVALLSNEPFVLNLNEKSRYSNHRIHALELLATVATARLRTAQQKKRPGFFEPEPSSKSLEDSSAWASPHP